MSSGHVYVLLEFYPHDGSALHGVYSTEDAAEAAKETAGEGRFIPGREWHIHIVEIDAAPKARHDDGDLVYLDQAP